MRVRIWPAIVSSRLEPLLFRIQQRRSAVLCPSIDLINDHTMAYIVSRCREFRGWVISLDYLSLKGTGSGSVGGFSWSLHFSWIRMPARIRDAQKSKIDPYPYVCFVVDMIWRAQVLLFGQITNDGWWTSRCSSRVLL